MLQPEPKKFIYAKHVAFDWGLTLAPDPRYKIFPEIAEELSEIFEECFHIPAPASDIEKKFFEIDSQTKVSWGIGVTHFNQEELIIAELLENFGMPYSDIAINAPLVLSLYRRKLKEFYSKLNWNKEVKDVLQFLKSQGFFISIFSNDRKHTIRAALEWSGIRNFFDYVATAHEYEIQKPDARAMGIFLQETGFKPEETVYVGDDPIRDIKWAKSVGVQTILFIPPKDFAAAGRVTTWRSTDLETQPDAIIKDFSELKTILKKI